jgi:thiol-disulfide isomerase/thioredoxin
VRATLLIVVLAIAGAALGFVAGGWMQSPATMPALTRAAVATGDTRPDLVLPDLDARPRDLSEWDGKLVLLNFWASWCGPCIEEMPLLDRTQQRHAGDGLQVIGVAVDDADDVRAFLARHGVSYPILLADPNADDDASVRFGDNRGVLPYSVLIGPDRRVLERRFGNFTEANLASWLAPHLPRR